MCKRVTKGVKYLDFEFLCVIDNVVVSLYVETALGC